MRAPLRDRLGLWLEQFGFLHRWLFRYDGPAPGGGARAVNRINGHVVLLEVANADPS